MSERSSSASPTTSSPRRSTSRRGEVVEDALVHVEPRAGGARLALAGEAHRGDDVRDGGVVARVRDRRSTAPCRRARATPGGSRSAAARIAIRPTSVEPVNEIFAMPGVVEQRAAALLAVARDHVQDAVGQVARADLGHAQHAERCVLGGLEHERVAGAQRHRDLQRREQHRRVPRHDRRHDAQRLAHAVAEHARRRAAAPRPSARSRRRRSSGARRRPSRPRRAPACGSRCRSRRR